MVGRGASAMKSFLWAGLAVLGAAGAAVPVGAQATPSPAQPSALQESLQRAFQDIADGKGKEARTELEKAQKLAAGPCGPCLLGMSHVDAMDSEWKKSEKEAKEAIPLLSSPALKARAYSQLARAAYQSGNLDQAEESYRHAVDGGGPWGSLARYNLSQVLLTQKRWAESAEMARSYIKEAGAQGTVLNQARIVLCQARANLSEEPAPPLKAADEASKSLADARKVEGQVTRPEVLFQPRPVYPEQARRAGDEGTVVVESIIDQEGCVTNVRLLKEQPHGLADAAENAVRRWVFKPATLAGEPVKVFYVLTVNFQVQKGPAMVMPGVVP